MPLEDRYTRIDHLFERINRDLTVLTWMVAAVLVLTIVIAARVYGVI